MKAASFTSPKPSTSAWRIAEPARDRIRKIAPETDSAAPNEVIAFTPFQVGPPDVASYRSRRSQFSTDDWLGLMLQSAGYAAGAFPNRRQRLLLLARLVPLVERNVNVVELGPRQTGKTFLLRNVSPRVFTLSGGKASPANLVLALTIRGRAYFAVGDPADALKDLDAAIAADPKNSAALVLRGGVYSAPRAFDPAIADYDAALRIDAKMFQRNLTPVSLFSTGVRIVKQGDQWKLDIPVTPALLESARYFLDRWPAYREELGTFRAYMTNGRYDSPRAFESELIDALQKASGAGR